MGICIKMSATLNQADGTNKASQNNNSYVTPPRRLIELELDKYICVTSKILDGEEVLCIKLQQQYSDTWAPEYDSTRLCAELHLDTEKNDEDLEREIYLAMLLSPEPFIFPSQAELSSSVRIRKNVVQAARKTSLNFNTDEAERPADYWTYQEDTGFIVKPGKSLITALQLATQPEESGQLYSFSCYRATEYVILLAIALELHSCNPELYAKLEKQWQTHAIMSGKFHDVFLREYGSMEHPLPPRFFVPGDRLWFRNPDENSAEATGYEGSWVFYLGNGMFNNFWNHKSPYTLFTKCVEIYHWRNSAFQDASGENRIDEDKVSALVQHTFNHPAEQEAILQQMMRYRDPKGVYQNGGCLDTTREYPRCVCPGTSDMAIERN